jgi:integrase
MIVVKNRFRLVQYRSLGGMFYLHDNQTDKRLSLETKDEHRATELLVAHNEAAREPGFNLLKARVYMAASDPEIGTRTWQKALDAVISAKRSGSANRRRWETFAKDKAIKPLLKMIILETRADQLLAAVLQGKVSTNVFLRRLQNFCIGMNWLPWPILPPKLWPPVKFKNKRAIKLEEHRKIVARETNEERRDFYELLWELGGSQSDIACLEAEDIDWTDSTICYNRKKLAGLGDSDIKPPLIKFGKRCAEILRRLPQSGSLFPYLRSVDCKDRATEFRQRCKGLGIDGVTLHSYRYAWAERARKAHYPRRQAEEALGHNSRAVHIAYAKRAQVTVDSLEDYEELAAKSATDNNSASSNPALPGARA